MGPVLDAFRPQESSDKVLMDRSLRRREAPRASPKPSVQGLPSWIASLVSSQSDCRHLIVVFEKPPPCDYFVCTCGPSAPCAVRGSFENIGDTSRICGHGTCIVTGLRVLIVASGLRNTRSDLPWHNVRRILPNKSFAHSKPTNNHA